MLDVLVAPEAPRYQSMTRLRAVVNSQALKPSSSPSNVGAAEDWSQVSAARSSATGPALMVRYRSRLGWNFVHSNPKASWSPRLAARRFFLKSKASLVVLSSGDIGFFISPSHESYTPAEGTSSNEIGRRRGNTANSGGVTNPTGISLYSGALEFGGSDPLEISCQLPVRHRPVGRVPLVAGRRQQVLVHLLPELQLPPRSQSGCRWPRPGSTGCGAPRLPRRRFR